MQITIIIEGQITFTIHDMIQYFFKMQNSSVKVSTGVQCMVYVVSVSVARVPLPTVVLLEF